MVYSLKNAPWSAVKVEDVDPNVFPISCMSGTKNVDLFKWLQRLTC